MKKVSTTWFSTGFDSAVSCPVEGCNHTGQVITIAHLRIQHGMTREEVAEKYGYPEIVQSRGVIKNEANGKRWNSTAITSDI
ncbi:MAG: hypothetical protein ABS882_01415 [Lysinibacillus sp.]